MSKHYTVRAGDTLYGIAKVHGVPLSAVYRANHAQLANVNFYRLPIGLNLTIPTPAELGDHERQMRQEKDEAVCDRSPTERHIFQISYDYYGRANYQQGGVVNCEACGRYIKQDGARWVTTKHGDDVKLFEQLPQLVIQEELAIEDVI